ncbi:hypothetical protein IDH44_25040 [Paenibacillus sp. IB182496]|uniref:Uncharacterized protein n=1 Tax=Paenibacillus sabuli TaxID=2772509 RepID=A0A927GUK8_9BACL|nr:hypothetical protein [Paenibacillus sabuli]MBD2848461.1 hypothetical protein [Paenibacillus sabuli]
MDQAEAARIVARLSERPLQALAPRVVWDEVLERDIAALSPASGRAAELALKSGLHLWNDSLNASHTLSQDIDDATGSYWHGIMHRMEGDYSNAKYWFRRAGAHPAMRELGERAAALLASRQAALDIGAPIGTVLSALLQTRVWDAAGFVDAVSAQMQGSGDEVSRELLELVQREEMLNLIEYCAAQADL